jgi:hypothetical protein
MLAFAMTNPVPPLATPKSSQALGPWMTVSKVVAAQQQVNPQRRQQNLL